MQQVFWSHILAPDEQQLELGDSYYQHLIRVLHFQEKSQFWLVDAQQQTFLATVEQITTKNFVVRLQAKSRRQTELPVQVTVACALSKKDKVELIAQKATELGATKMIFFESRYSIMKWKKNVQAKKIARLQEIVTAAAAQSQRLFIPEVSYFNWAQLLDYRADYRLVAYEEAAKQGEIAQLAQTLQQVPPQASLICLFGPEGGFNVEEIAQLRQNKYTSCGLGPRILRAETAPLYFLSALSYQIELNKEY
ncbi:16S rRNA (uracil(1498)-N(3))-methyltransferase [Bombilactobacillus folatiphilus]|uniref:Ribosomal RNA small subunit methyltransferase E n=1 Tax=Bombilactobacillus folatiphilus TaxID=2923362 RepID=A0ABY4P765_9LACO|nr:16S rRNA (uracil(1498)-N(3))-methyltransferase [Bombilactobacillus folatiphilus]UQS81544.1 16S rRNA (uracil(1498)-N(3))-methyltransferase [Bombilactobacillus folatiphilus]